MIQHHLVLATHLVFIDLHDKVILQHGRCSIMLRCVGSTSTSQFLNACKSCKDCQVDFGTTHLVLDQGMRRTCTLPSARSFL